MTADKLWSCGRSFTATEADGSGERQFRGFLEALGAQSEKAVLHTRAGTVSPERFRLIAEPAESFPGGAGTRVLCGETEYRVLSVRELYAGGGLSHRECILRKAESGA